MTAAASTTEGPPGSGGLRLLLVEDSADDALLLERVLRRAGYDVWAHRVQTAEALREALRRATWDVVLSDHTMPAFSGSEALAIVRQSGLDLPFIVVSGTLGEEAAVEALKAGAHDFLGKSNLVRLVPAIERELREAQARRDAAALRTAFLAVTAHELRTPLTILNGMGELAVRALPGGSPEARLVEQMVKAGARLERLVDQIVVMLEAGAYRRPLEVAELDLAELLTAAADDVRPFTADRNLELVVAAPPSLGAMRLDAERIRSCLDHLLVNAVKFTPDGGRVELAAERTPDGGARIRVSDTGIGIDARDRPRLFEPFFTGFDWKHHSSGHHEFGKRGLGLGLAMVKAFVEMHGGQVEVDSTPGLGTTFTLLLPPLDWKGP